MRWYVSGPVREGSLFGTEQTQFLDVTHLSAPRTGLGRTGLMPRLLRAFLMLDESLS
uniref:Uncharacterized protein n=1 Tax=Utricularia reniformis TaxID=192314 RepID=A0A1Y0B139_9LAMI|nr:hypothetical protein AEK19_MT0879 [Utricularia reniformis]ART31111.1 hypothetical protein AEK19_MT0879 [Utricularia reniformis]